MDKISLLPDECLLQILSLLTTRDVLKTSLLSKRWQDLWKLVPKLQYINYDEDAELWKFFLFVERSLLLNTAPVLESLHFKFVRKCRDVDIGFWVRIAVKRGLRELDFDYSLMIDEPIRRLPQSLFTCGTLVVLKLKHVSLVDVRFPVCFQLLKTLHLEYVIFLDDESPRKLLSSCPVLEVLVLDRKDDGVDNVGSFSVMVPSLQRFVYYGRSGSELELSSTALKYLKLLDRGYQCKIKYLPEIVEAHVEVTCSKTDDILRSIASVKRLYLCLPIEPEFPTGSIFHRLEHLEFCNCESLWDILMSMLQQSPKLRSLKLNEIHGYYTVSRDPMLHWDEPSTVPETLTSVLETFEWRNYRGWKTERELATFILKHSKRLKIATFSLADCTYTGPEFRTTVAMKYRMFKELTRLPRGSTECELVFC
ncbi:PREDICTED: FBD-associated F-box protein At5g56370-like [Camelina sativa]|uniref:FBD-associated F-box protein At5g56370-like n=1 Tax=Camelina sativa TaxID=90675 RepID=A0ABM0V5E8_CAMSA|nr:PREDICTED: FBD-associated F-box protein At5g56370-like [Camelina sativa]XP_010451017.1 PREDICTED: FBD-associated F-box protein At5g56370-like [Camelina sativa]XP_010451024.1 PREDICTED: FBD-associated F-box protein At5g56370-like [Camelina sativa]